jgi:DNA-binding NarL/FixJ family response regulator
MISAAVHHVLARPDVTDTQILRLLAAGQTHTEIGRVVGLPKDAVGTHMRRLSTKVNACNSNHLIAIAFRNGWIE